MADIKDVLDVPVYLHPADELLYKKRLPGGAALGHPLSPARRPPTQPLEAAQVLTFGGAEVQCLFTPGHAPGHISFYLPSEGYVIAGDALFKGSIGRTDLPLGDQAQLLESIQNPAHDPARRHRGLPWTRAGDDGGGGEAQQPVFVLTGNR